ncbi:PREDICTED: SCL-interrupting locus protein [Nanorana parkeri]|uniref:SCL-interrupting locus protein n=1 Tax=Nanorana parkeri TaxID=125878 RepID=UPI000854680D|nr:PREDICTED: SCL-interrupting locus protein [Nanorana parkeri]
MNVTTKPTTALERRSSLIMPIQCVPTTNGTGTHWMCCRHSCRYSCRSGGSPRAVQELTSRRVAASMLSCRHGSLAGPDFHFRHLLGTSGNLFSLNLRPHLLQDQPAFTYAGKDQPAFTYAGEDRPAFTYAGEDRPAFTYAGEDRPAFTYAGEDRPAFTYAGEDRPAFTYAGEDRPAFTYAGKDPGFHDMSAKMSLQHHKPVSNENQINVRNVSNRMLPIHFPPTKTVLWDSTPIGEPIGLHFSYYRNPHLLLSEKALRLAYRHAKTERRVFCCFLLGSFSVDDDEEGVTLTIDRFVPGREKSGVVGKVPSALLPGDFVIPCSVYTRESAGNITLHTPEEFASSFKGLQSHLHCKEALDLSKLLTVRAHITYSENMDNLHFDLRWAAVTVANSFESTPIKPVPIIPTALARNLSSHNNIAQLQGTHKCGYILLLVLESDPKAYTLPLVGIWLSGITHIHSPQVWASCLRYLFSSSIKERVLSESGSFLIVLYSLTHKEPEFYECIQGIGHDPLGYQLLACEDSIHLFKNVESSKQSSLLFELTTESQNSEAYLLSEVSKTVSNAGKHHASPTKLSVSDHDSGVEDEDFSPRPSPHPHPSFQQVTKIHPSVPELSLVFGSVVEPKPAVQNLQINNKKAPSLSSTPKVVNNQFMTSSYPHHDSYGKESMPKPLPVPFKTCTPTATKLSRGKSSAGDKAHYHSNGQPRRSSTSSSTSSSSHSTPRTGSSPDTSVHQVKGSSELDLRCSVSGPCPEPPPLTSSPYSRQSSLSPNHNATFPLQTRPLSDGQKPTQNFSTCRHQTNICSCCVGIGPVQCHSPTSWPAVSHISHRSPESQSEPLGNVMPFYQNMPCPNACCSPVLMNCGRTARCATPVDGANSPGRRDSLPVNSCSSNPCMVMTPPSIPGPSGMWGLSTEAYQLLTEQDKQLKLLQAQIQRLLEAQASQGEFKPSRAEKAAESVATETESSEPMLKTSVSIAVGTGASLYWNPPPCPEEEESLNKQDESELCNVLTAAVNNEQDTSSTTITSSLKSVDMYSFAESSQLTDCAGHSPLALQPICNTRNEPQSSQLLHDGRSSTSASGYDASQEHPENQKTSDHGLSVPSLASERFYQGLLNQVNNLLKTSSSASEESCENISRVSSRASESVSEKPRDYVARNPRRSDQHSVQKATLKQLKSLGVEIGTQPSEVKLNSADTADNACVLACINPDAIIPRLNYMSFTNLGLSGFVPSGVDLSMEANAIALKYLSESQLTQLSLSHTNRNKDLDSSSFHNLFPGTSERSMVGLSLISPNNMSFATKKYLKRYALMESNDSSDDEDPPSETGYTVGQTDRNKVFSDLSDNNPSLDLSSESKATPRASDKASVEFVYHPEGNKLRNITNEMPKKAFPTVQTSDEASLHFLKDINPRSKLLSENTQFKGHHDKENGRNSPLFNTRDANSLGRKVTGPAGSLEDILDVDHLRQLPKLF